MPHAGSPDFGVSRQLRVFNKIPNYPASTLGVAVQSGSCVEFLGGSESATAVPEVATEWTRVVMGALFLMREMKPVENLLQET